MPDLVTVYRNTVAKPHEPKPDVFIYGGCQKTRMPLKFRGAALLNLTLIIERGRRRSPMRAQPLIPDLLTE